MPGPFGLVAIDGADHDGGTLYALLDNGRPVLTAAWPMPLEQHAAREGRGFVRLPAYDGQLLDITTKPRRRPMTAMNDDLSPRRRLAERGEILTVDQVQDALAATRALIGELERHLAEERDNLAQILAELQHIQAVS